MQTRQTDEELVAALASGREVERQRALQTLTQHWCPKIIAYVTQNKGSQEDGEEVFSEALFKFDCAVRKKQFRGESQPYTYFFAIARNEWSHRAKAEQRRREYTFSLEDTHVNAKAEDFEQLLLNKEYETVFDQVMAHISPRCQRIFQLARLGYSGAEIAAEVDISNADQLKKEKNRCSNRLHERFKEHPALARFFKKE